jgi:hypothetical protein
VIRDIWYRQSAARSALGGLICGMVFVGEEEKLRLKVRKIAEPRYIIMMMWGWCYLSTQTLTFFERVHLLKWGEMCDAANRIARCFAIQIRLVRHS